MQLATNTITTGYYKNASIVLKGTNADIPVLICKGFLSRTEIPMDKTTIKAVNHSILPNAAHEIIIEWKDGKLSQAILDNAVYAAVQIKIT